MKKAEKFSKIIKKYKYDRRTIKTPPNRIHLICQNHGILNLRNFRIKKIDVDIDLNYNDDFKETDKIIKSAIDKESNNGLILLHGIAGAGKTTYIRHLIGISKKRIIYAPPDFAEAISSPDLMGFMINYPDSVLIIEDAENVIQERSAGDKSAVSNILNLCDGLLSDCLNMTVICTFNTDVAKIDTALLRKGRLLAKYEFRELEKSKAQKLSNHLGFKSTIEKDMTLAEIYNQNDSFSNIKNGKIGFKLFGS